MNPEREDPLIDALLEETLGGAAPPDLTSRILKAWSEREAGIGSARPTLPLSVLSSLAEPAPPPLPHESIASPVVRSTVTTKSRRRRTSAAWLQFVSSLAVAAAVLLVAFLGLNWNHNEADRVAEINPKPPLKSPLVHSPIIKPGKLPEKATITIPTQPVDESNFAIVPTPPKPSPQTKPPKPTIDGPKYEASPDEAIVAFVNAELRESWQKSQVKPAPVATDAEFCRRAFLRIVGRIPTVEELKAYTNQSSKKKSAELVNNLLDSEMYRAEFAQHWASVWANVLIGRAAGNEPGEAANRAGLEEYLLTALAERKPFSEVALELISATGAGQPGADNFNGAANYLLAHADEQGIVPAARTCRVFLGVQLQCAQCHDHPTEPISQKHFWSMTAFFRQMRVSNDRNNPAELNDLDYLGYDGRDEDGLVFYETPSGLMKAVGPEFIDGKQLPAHSGRVAEVRRREALAKFVVESDQFNRATMNRLWSQFLGFGFTPQVDAVGESSPASHPELFDRLSKEFAAHNYDLAGAMRWIALSDAFNRSSQGTGMQLADMADLGTAPLFSRYYTRQLPAEEVFRSLQIAARLRGEGGDVEKARMTWLAQMAKKSGDEESAIDPSVISLNSTLVRHATTPGQEKMLHTVTNNSKLSFVEKVEHLFLAALSRKPSRTELELAQKLSGMNERNQAAALEDVWWAILNSNEFILDH